MPVAIPRLNRFEPSPTMAKNDRINMQVNDQASNILSTTKTVTEFGEAGADMYQKYENDKIDQLSNSAETEFKQWNDQELEKLKDWKGDPTDAYAKYDEQVKEKYKEILDKRPDLNERVKRHLTARLDKTVESQNQVSMKQRGAQQEAYRQTVYKTTLSSRKQDLVSRATNIEVGNPDSYASYQEGMGDITTLMAKHGLRDGTVTELPADAKSWSHKYISEDLDENGKPKEIKVSFTPMAKQALAKELSEGVKNTLDSLIGAGELDTAKDFHEKYKNHLDLKSKLAVEKKLNGKETKKEAYSFLTTLQGKSEDAQLEAVENIKNEELKKEVINIKAANDSKLAAMKERRSKINHDTLYKHVDQLIGAGQIHGIADLENDPVYSQTWDNLSPKQQKSIKEMIEAPKETDPKAEAAVLDLFLGDSEVLQSMTPSEFSEKLTGVSKSDKKKYMDRFMNLKNPAESKKRAIYNVAGGILQREFLIEDHISRSKYTGKISGDDEIVLLKAKRELNEYISQYPGELKYEQIEKFVKSYAAAQIKKKAFNPDSVEGMPTRRGATGSNQPIRMRSREELRDWKAKYRQETGKTGLIKDDDPEFASYLRTNYTR